MFSSQPPAAANKCMCIVVTRSKAAFNIVKYDWIGAMQSQEDVAERRAQLSMDYIIHQLPSQGIPFFVVPSKVPDSPWDM